jgi:hypothetical protein
MHGNAVISGPEETTLDVGTDELFTVSLPVRTS